MKNNVFEKNVERPTKIEVKANIYFSELGY